MPHKMNTRSARAGQRACRAAARLRRRWPASWPATSGTRATSRARWSAGSRCPDAFFALDGLLETTLTVLDDFGAFPAVIERELDRYLPFLATTKVLMAAVRAGVGREAAHEAIKETRRGGRAGDAREGHRRATTCSTGSPPTRGSGSRRAELDALLAEPIDVHRRGARAGGRGASRPSTPSWLPIRRRRATARSRSDSGLRVTEPPLHGDRDQVRRVGVCSGRRPAIRSGRPTFQ